MSPTTPDRVAGADRLLAALPAIYGEDPLLASLLAPFERILLGGGDEGDGAPEGLEEAIDRLHELFDPARAPERFLPWLASWVGSESPEDLDVAVRRRLVAAAVDLGRGRGTPDGLQRVLEMTTGGQARVTEPSGPDFQIGVHSTIGVDAFVEGPDLRCFHVELSSLPESGVEEIARRTIERERPAHTSYTLTVSPPGED